MQLVREGRLREFRDGANLLFKVDEVEALMSDTIAMGLEDSSIASKQQEEQPEESAAEASIGEPEESAPKEEAEEEISLAAESGEQTAVPMELTGADTAITDEGTSVLGEIDSTAEEVKAESKAAPEESAVEKIEEDVNLDTFGTGSGLLDLSLQADDTSLGSILDEIYTQEGEPGQATDLTGSAGDLGGAAGEMLPESAVPEAVPGAAAIFGRPAETVPDSLSNALGIMMFLPLLAIAYTAIVSVATLRDASPVILEKIRGISGPYELHIIWYIMVGACLVTGLFVLVGFMLSRSSVKPAKKPKARKQKRPKS